MNPFIIVKIIKGVIVAVIKDILSVPPSTCEKLFK